MRTSSLALLSPSLPHAPADVRNAPREPGIYGWLFIPGALPVPRGHHHQSGGLDLLYVGIAPRKPSAEGRASRSTLRPRLRTHVFGDASRSTLRLTLGVLLRETLGLKLGMHRGRLNFGAPGEDLLSGWVADNARVVWATDAEPWLAERELIHAADLPLNLDDNGHHPFSAELAARRAEARAEARSLVPDGS